MDEKQFQEEVQYFNFRMGEVIEQKMQRCSNEILYDALNYIKDTSGKRLRPIICLLSAEAAGGSREQALFAAIAIEFIHNASLVHDDIIDDNYIRRKTLSNPAMYGEKKAIVIGDLLFGLSCEMLGKCRVPEVVGLISSAILDVAMGEYLEFTLRTSQEATEQSYLEVATLKTASTFMASAEAGAMLGGGSKAAIENLRNYGKNVGIAFQIQDDILDICGDTAKTGKPVGLDIKNGERTILLIHALNHSERSEREYISEIMAGKRELDRFDIDRMREIFIKSGSIDYALQLSNKLVRAAKRSIAGLEESEANSKLQLITDLTAKRIENPVLDTFIQSSNHLHTH
jgi:geranylgeranyl pyrophosphate synthase